MHDVFLRVPRRKRSRAGVRSGLRVYVYRKHSVLDSEISGLKRQGASTSASEKSGSDSIRRFLRGSYSSLVA